MTAFWCIVGALLLNLVVGAAVWAAFDDPDYRWFKWYQAAPFPLVMQPLMLTCWPLRVYWRLTREIS